MELSKLGFKSKTQKRIEDLAAGAFAGAAANYAVKPIDVIADTKVQGQFLGKKFSPAAKKTVLNQIKEMYEISRKANPGALGGLRGFFAGAGLKALKVAPATALSFMLYGLAKDYFRKNK